MSITSIVLITILLPMIYSDRPKIKLTFTPDEKFMTRYQTVEIHCEILNPNERTDFAQLRYVDFKSGQSTVVSRTLLKAPTNDSPEIFRNNRNNRYDYLKKSHIRIKNLQVTDSARYECDCPDCVESIPKQSQDLFVMKLADPTWHFEPGWPLHENSKAIMRCEVNDFYPYGTSRILRNNQDITNQGKSTLTSNSAFSQKLVWEGPITPQADWHNQSLRCTVTQGNTEKHASTNLDVLFAPQFLKCDDRQFVDPKREQSSIECSYRGNPEPQLVWLRKSDKKFLTTGNGITVQVKDEGQNTYKSIVTFDRNKLSSLPWTATTTTSPNGQGDASGEDYYQQLLNKGFDVKLTVNGNEKASKAISITPDARQIQSKFSNSPSKMSLSKILFFFLFILQRQLY